MADFDEEIQIQKLQERINKSLIETPEDRASSRFSPYIFEPKSADLAQQFFQIAASIGGLQGLEAALDKFDKLAEHEDKVFLHYELMRFLTHYPEIAKFGLHIPSLEQRSAWKTIPSKKKNS